MQSLPVEDDRMTTYHQLMGTARQAFSEHALASMLASSLNGQSAMPERLGLDARLFRQMLEFHFPDTSWPVAGAGAGAWDAAQMPEYNELKQLFSEYQASHVHQQPWWIELLIVGCSGRNHLWADLGLFERGDLNLLMHSHFPGLAAKNERDMKWKKFIYKQLCEREGIIACPAPTCDACAHFSECFAPED